ncbi:uncharacterized protein LOC111615156 [Centruroides sculpturatus]|uniref:uncharacterized protein LOC111615156 n=1 Tax=Centruroides sculpturatus TaxID=218467 RepID=UPI000C6D85C3|nr:uncharacterized protein LOC111615156 [Centruroides sculpturatus]
MAIEVEKGGEISTKVYRKATYNLLLIPWTSHNLASYKIAAFWELIERAYTHCNKPQDRIKELDHIKELARQCGISQNMIKAIINKRRIDNNEGNEQERIKEYTVMEYMESNSIPDAMHRQGRHRSEADSRIYRIPVLDKRRQKELYYIGASGRSLKERLKEHKRNVQNEQPVTTLATYVIADLTEVIFFLKGTNLKGKAQLNSNSKTNKTLFSSASQSFLNFTTKKLNSKGAVSKASSVENKEFPHTLNKESFVSKTFNSSKTSQTFGANSTGKATGEFCCKRKGVSVSSNNIGASDKKKLQKSEQKLQSKNDDTVIKNFKAKRFFSCSDKGKNKSLVNSKKTSTSKLCISYSKNKNAEDKIDKVKYKKDNENKICEKDNDPNLTLQNLCKSEQDHAVSKEDSFSNNYNFTKSLSDDTSTRRQIKGRQNNPDIKSDSELYGDIHLKSVLKVLRSNLSPEEKLSAIKYSHDYWQKIKNGEIACDDLDKFTENITLKSLTNSVRRKKFDRLTTDHEIFAKSNIKEKCTKTGMKTLNKMTSLPVCLNMPKSNSEQIALSSKLEEEILVTQLENEHVENSACNISVNVSESAQLAKGTPPPKSPVTIQDWVNSIDLTTGDESFSAHNLHGVHGYIAGKRSADASPSTLSPQPNKITLDDLRCKQSSFNSETSGISGISSISSVESLLEARREDPEEILLALGFGGKQSYDPLSRIPQRFLKQHSQVRGVDINTFLQQQEDLYHRHDNSSLGYMGLSGQYESQIGSSWSLPAMSKQENCIKDIIIRNIDSHSEGARKSKKKMGVKFVDGVDNEFLHQQSSDDKTIPCISVTISSEDSNQVHETEKDWWQQYVEKSDVTVLNFNDIQSNCNYSSTDICGSFKLQSSQKRMIHSSLV